MATIQLNHLQDYEGKQIQGTRDYQEDDFGFDASYNDLLLIQLADGMGGYAGGDTASGSAIQAFMDIFDPTDGRTTSERLVYALNSANDVLTKTIEEKPELAGMGCTFVGAVLSNKFSRLHWVSVGDSPFWLFRNGVLTRLNADHSKRTELEEQVQKGEITQSVAAKDPDRNSLTSALVGEEINLIDNNSKALEPGDILLLASDGLLTLSKEEIIRILNTNTTAERLADRLLGAVHRKNRPSQDNTTVLIVKTPPPIKLEPTLTNATSKSTDTHWSLKPKKGNLKYIIISILLIIALLLAFLAGSNFSKDEKKPAKAESTEQSAKNKELLRENSKAEAVQSSEPSEVKQRKDENPSSMEKAASQKSKNTVDQDSPKEDKQQKGVEKNKPEVEGDSQNSVSLVQEEKKLKPSSIKTENKEETTNTNQGFIGFLKEIFIF